MENKQTHAHQRINPVIQVMWLHTIPPANPEPSTTCPPAREMSKRKEQKEIQKAASKSRPSSP